MLLLLVLSVPFAWSADSENLAMRVDMNESVRFGENIEFRVDVFNTSNEDITLNFNSSLQIDFTIGDYRYSENNVFTQALTEVTIAANELHSWKLECNSPDTPIEPGYYELKVELVGYGITHERKLAIQPARRVLPEGLVMEVGLIQRSYNPGDPITFELLVTNETDEDVTIQVNKAHPLAWSIFGKEMKELDPTDGVLLQYNYLVDSQRPEYVDTLIPAGETVTWDGRTYEEYYLKGGDYTFSATLNGFDQWVSTQLMIQDVTVYGTVNGTVGLLDHDSDIILPTEDVTVTLRSFSDTWDDGIRYFAPLPDEEARTAVTDSEGKYVFEDVELGSNYTLEVNVPGYYSYISSFYMNKLEKIINPYMKEEYYQGPRNYTKSKVGPVGITFGSNKAAYSQNDNLYAYFDLYNYDSENISFEYEGDHILTWSLADKDGNVFWTDTDYVVEPQTILHDMPVELSNNEGGIEKNDAGEDVIIFDQDNRIAVSSPTELVPNSSAQISFKWQLKDILDGRTGEFTFSASLDYVSCSHEDVEVGQMAMSVPLIVGDTTSKEITVSSQDKQFTAEVNDGVRVMVGADLSDDVEDYINISELRENHLAALTNSNFIKMIDINAGESITSNLKKATVRIYFDSSDSAIGGELVIAHWIENENRWEKLETTVNNEMNYAEANTDGFSYFGLFETFPTSVEDETPETFSLGQNMPNPFNPSTTIRFTIPDAGHTKLDVYNMAGQLVATLADMPMSAGSHSFVFDGSQYSSGIYFYRLVHGSNTVSKRMLLIK